MYLRYTENEPQVAVAHLFVGDTVTIRLFDPVTANELSTFSDLAFEIQNTGRFSWNLTNLIAAPPSKLLIYLMRNQDGIEQTGFIDLNPLSDQEEVLAKLQEVQNTLNAIRDFPALFGAVENNDSLLGLVEEEELTGELSQTQELIGTLEEEELEGIVSDAEVLTLEI